MEARALGFLPLVPGTGEGLGLGGGLKELICAVMVRGEKKDFCRPRKQKKKRRKGEPTVERE
jgi:hypothetical protein